MTLIRNGGEKIYCSEISQEGTVFGSKVGEVMGIGLLSMQQKKQTDHLG
jgi:hypothetical protein